MAGNQAVIQLLADGHAAPSTPPNGQRGMGNWATAALLAGVIQRESPAKPTKGSEVGAKPGTAKAKAKTKTKSPSNSYGSLVDVVNNFQDLAAAAVNRQGAGLESVRFGRDLSPDHRYLLNRVRAVMLQGRSKEKEERAQAAQSWPWLSQKLQGAVAEATKLNFPGDVLVAVNDAIAQVGTRYFRARPRASDPQPETFESYQDVIRGINELTFAFERMGESGEGIIREEVPKRNDVAVSQAVVEINKKQRDRLERVKLGSNLTRQHLRALETLRAVLITARTETAGSAYKAWARWQRLEGTLDRMLKRTLVFAETDLGPVQQSLDRARDTLASHYRAVHTQGLRTALTKERSLDEKKIDKSMGEALGPGGAEVIKEVRAIEDFRHALTTIEQHLGPSPARPDEWILIADGRPIRIRGEQGLAIREAARTQIREYMAHLVTEMVQAWDTYDQIKRGTGSTRRKVLGFFGGADDPGDQSDARNAIIDFRDRVVYKLADEGKYVAALEAILGRKGDVERRARAVGDYDTDLDKGYKRLAIGASVVQVALVSLVPVAGQLAMAPTVVGGVIVAEGATALAVGGTAVAAGAIAPAAVETGRQIASDEPMNYGKILTTAKTGALIGAGAVTPNITKGISNFIAPNATGSALVGANMAASSLVGGVQDYAGGGTGFAGAAGGAFGSMAGSVVNSVAPIANAPVKNMLAQGGAGALVAHATGQDVPSGFVGGMVGSLGDKALAKHLAGGGGGGGSGGTPTTSGTPGPGDTLPGFGFDGRGPAFVPGAGDTLPGTGIDPRLPAGIGGGGSTMLGTGIDPRAPAPTRNTMLGTGIEPRLPAGQTGDTLPGVGGVRRPPGTDPLGDTIPGGQPAGGGPPPTVASPDALGDTLPAGGGGLHTGAGKSLPPDPAKLKGGQGTASQFATLRDYKGKKPIEGNIAHRIDNADEAAALYRRLSGEDRRPALGSEDAGEEQGQWSGDGGTGDAPMVWVRSSDGVVRFNFSKFPRPNLGGYTDQPLGPIRLPGGKDGPPPPSGGPPVTPKPAYFPGSSNALQPGMRPARIATDAEVAWHSDNNASKVYQAKTKQQYEDWYRMDQGEGEVPDAFWSGSTIIVKPGKPLGMVGDKNDPTSRARTMPEDAYEAKPKQLTDAELKEISAAEERVRVALEARLSNVRNGRTGSQSAFRYEQVVTALKAEPGLGTNQVVLDHAEVVWQAVHDPVLIARVMSKAYGAALRDMSTTSAGKSDVTKALLREAGKAGPIHVVPKGSEIDPTWFFEFWVKTGRRFFDLGIDTESHGQITHIIQDLVVDAAFKERGMKMTSAEFRRALGGIEAKGVPDPRNELWVWIFDATDGGINQPEVLMPALRDVAELKGTMR